MQFFYPRGDSPDLTCDSRGRKDDCNGSEPYLGTYATSHNSDRFKSRAIFFNLAGFACRSNILRTRTATKSLW
jgi:hypothetical protein